MKLQKDLPPTLLPWPADDVITPSIVLRSALFSSVSAHLPFEYVKNKTIYAQGDVLIEFTGELLNQHDLDVWLGILRLIALSNSSTIVLESNRSFLEMMGVCLSGASNKKLIASIKKLTSCMVVITNKNKNHVYGGHMISGFWVDETKGRLALKIDESMIALFTPGNWTRIDWEIRKSLRQNPTAAWLHSYYSSHKNSSIPIGIETIRKLSGSKNSSITSFKQVVKKAAALVSEACKKSDREFILIFKGDNIYVTHTLGNKKQKSLNIPRGETYDIEDM